MASREYVWTAVGTPIVAATSQPSNRSFGVSVGGVLVLLSGISWWRGHLLRAEIVAAIGAVLLLGGLFRPGALGPLAAGWARIGHALGWFNSRVLLALIFFVVLVPAGAVGRLLGYDPLGRRRRDRSRWLPYPSGVANPKHFERWF